MSGQAAVAAVDTAAPVLSEFDFTPKSVDVADGGKSVTVTARVTDATGAEAPVMLIGSDTTTQTAGFGTMSLVSGTTQDGVWSRTVSIPATAAPGAWTVKIYPLDDTAGNGETSFHNHPTKLTVTNGPAATAPAPPSGVSAIAGDQSAEVSWTAPAANGSPITGYTVTSAPGGVTTTVAGDQTTAAVAGLTNGTSYTFTVTATNAVGTSPDSAASAAVTPEVASVANAPDAPTGVQATRDDGSAAVSWSAPADHGSPITTYSVTVAPGGRTLTVPGDMTSAHIGGLANGTAYTFTVTATNAAGTSPASAPSAAVTPATTPGRVARPAVKVDGRRVIIKWMAPADGGSPLTGYNVSVNAKVRTTGADVRKLVLKNVKVGRYRVTVSAVSVLGVGPVSDLARFRVRGS